MRYYEDWDFDAMKGVRLISGDEATRRGRYVVHDPRAKRLTKAHVIRRRCYSMASYCDVYYGGDAVRVAIDADKRTLRRGEPLVVEVTVSTPLDEDLNMPDSTFFPEIRRVHGTLVTREVGPLLEPVPGRESWTHVWRSDEDGHEPPLSELPSGQYEIRFHLRSGPGLTTLPALLTPQWVGEASSNPLRFRIVE